MTDLRGLLSKTLPFSVLPAGEIARLAESAQCRAARRGERIYAEGDPAGLTYVVVSGQVRITRSSSDGKPLTIEVLKAGEVFGCVGCAAAGGYPCEAAAGSDAVVLALPMAAVARLLEKHSEFGRALYWDMSRRMREAQKFRSLGAETVERRIAGVLLWLGSKFGSDLPFTRQAIAEMASTTPESAIRTLIQFRRRGYVRTGWKKIVLQRSDALRRLLESQPA